MAGNQKYTVIDFFAGAGGLSLIFENFECRLYDECFYDAKNFLLMAFIPKAIALEASPRDTHMDNPLPDDLMEDFKWIE